MYSLLRVSLYNIWRREIFDVCAILIFTQEFGIWTYFSTFLVVIAVTGCFLKSPLYSRFFLLWHPVFSKYIHFECDTLYSPSKSIFNGTLYSPGISRVSWPSWIFGQGSIQMLTFFLHRLDSRLWNRKTTSK